MALKYRDVTDKDLPQLTNWIAADTSHQDSNTQFWMPQDADNKTKQGIKCIAIEDEEGVVFYVRLDSVVRARVQFSPTASVARTTKTLREAFAYLAAGAKASNYVEMIFDTVSAGLVHATRKLGFKAMKDTFQVHL